MKILDRVSRIDPEPLPRWQRWAVIAVQFVIVLGEQFTFDKLIVRASGLAYATLLATVPLAAVLFSLFSAFGSFSGLRLQVQEFLFSQLLPTRQDEFVAYINGFTENAHKLGFVGFVLLMITSIMLLDNIETNFNSIWHVSTRRRFINKITAYTSVLVFGAVFLGAGLTISARLQVMELMGNLLDLGVVARTWNWFFPLFLSWLAFVVMYTVIPFTRVRVASAMIGALIAAILWESGKGLFAASIGQSVRYSTIYGSLAAIPIFLVWIYITWIIVLAGLEISFTHQHFAALTRSRLAREATDRDRITLTLKVMTAIAALFHRGGAPPTADALSDMFHLPLELIDGRIQKLLDAQLIREAVGDGPLPAYVPARSLGEIRVAEVLKSSLDASPTTRAGQWIEKGAEATVSRFMKGGARELGALNVLDVVTEYHEEETPIVMVD